MSILELLSAIKKKVKQRLPISLLAGLLAAAATGFYINQQPVKYYATAKIFPLSANSAKGSSSPMSQIQQQFGIQTQTGGEVYDILELLNSKRLSFKVVGYKPTNKKYDKFYKWLVADHNSQLGWLADEIILSTKKEDSLQNVIIGRSLLLQRISVEESENGYTTLKVMSYDTELAKELTDNLLKALSEFYIEFVTEKPRSDLYRIQGMRDSLSIALTSVTKAIAGTQDQSAYSVKAYVGLPLIKLQREQAEIQAIYSTTVNALQNAKFKLLSESPIFQVLDYPGAPYITEKDDWKIPAVVIFILVTILFSLWFCRKIFGALIIEELKKA